MAPAPRLDAAAGTGLPPLLAGWPRSRLGGLVVASTLAGLAVAVGVATLAGQRHFRAEADAGADLGRLAALLADGSTARTAWVGWAMALFFAVATLRLLRGAPEEPLRLRGGEEHGVAALRRGLRREWQAGRWALSVLGLLTALDLGRLLVYAVAALRGVEPARDALLPLGIEVAGLCAAGVALAAWTLAFRRQLVRVGAL